MSPVVGYATLQVIPSLRGVHDTITQELNGRDIGSQVGSDMSAGMEEGFDSESLMDKLTGPMGAAGLALGTAIGAAALKGIQAAVEKQAGEGLVQAQLGLSEQQAAAYGETAGSVYAANFGDSLSGAQEAVAAVGSSLSGSLGPGEDALQRVTEQALTFAQVFGADVTEATTVAGAAIRVGLAEDATEAFDLMTAASQRMPAGIRAELLPAVEEYGVFLSELGFTGEEAFGLLAEASKGGAVQLDKAGDALKEFQIRSTDMSATSVAAFEAIGLDAQEMSAAILAGGETAKGAFDQIVAGLLAINDPVERATQSVALFGTPLEDISVSQIPSFLRSLQTSDDALGDFQGSTDAAADAVGDGLGAQLETFRREAMAKLVSFTEDRVLPAVSAFAAGIESVTGVASDNVPVVAGMAAAWAGLKAAAIASSVWTAMTVGATGTAGAFDKLAISAYNAAGAMTAVSGAAVTAGAFAGIVIGGVVAYQSLQRSADNATDANERFLDSIDADVSSNSIRDLNDDIQAMVSEIAVLEETAGKSNLEQFWQDINPFVDNDISEAEDRISGLEDQITSFTDKVLALSDVMVATGTSQDSLNDWIERLNLDPATMSVEEMTDAINEARHVSDQTDPTVDVLADSFATLQDETATATEEMNAFKDALDAVIGTQVAWEEAQLDFHDALSELSTAARDASDAGEEWSTNLFAADEASRETRRSVAGLVDEALNLAGAWLEGGGTIEEATWKLAEAREQIIQAGEAAGISREDMEAYLATLGLTPENITTIISAQTDEAGVSSANQAIDWAARNRQALITVDFDIRGKGVVVNGTTILNRAGGVYSFADGGMTPAHVALGTRYKWAEPETGGEAFIPRLGDRDRSLSVLRTAAGWLDASVVDRKRLAAGVGSFGASAPGPVIHGGVNFNVPAETAAEFEAKGGYRLRKMGVVAR